MKCEMIIIAFDTNYKAIKCEIRFPKFFAWKHEREVFIQWGVKSDNLWIKNFKAENQPLPVFELHCYEVDIHR